MDFVTRPMYLTALRMSSKVAEANEAASSASDDVLLDGSSDIRSKGEWVCTEFVLDGSVGSKLNIRDIIDGR